MVRKKDWGKGRSLEPRAIIAHALDAMMSIAVTCMYNEVGNEVSNELSNELSSEVICRYNRDYLQVQLGEQKVLKRQELSQDKKAHSESGQAVICGC